MKKYQKPEINNIGSLKTEQIFAAQSWNNGKGNTQHNGTGSGDSSNQWRKEGDTHGKNAG